MKGCENKGRDGPQDGLTRKAGTGGGPDDAAQSGPQACPDGAATSGQEPGREQCPDDAAQSGLQARPDDAATSGQEPGREQCPDNAAQSGPQARPDDAARKRAIREFAEAEEPLAVLEGKLGDFVGFVCAEIDQLCGRLQEGLDLPQNSRVVVDFDRLTHAMERLRGVLVEKHGEDEPGAAETLLDLMAREDELCLEAAGSCSPPEGGTPPDPATETGDATLEP